MQWIHVAAGAGLFFACLAAGAFLGIAFFGDLFLKSDESLRKAMDLVMYALLAAVAVVAFVAAAIVYRVCPLTPRMGI